MSAEAIVSALDSRAALVAGVVVIAVPLLALVALIGHLILGQVRKTPLGQWAAPRAEVRMDRVRDAYAARKRTKAGAS